MNVMPVAHFLKDFSDLPLPEPAGPSAEQIAEELAIAVEAARAEGHEAGRQDGLAEAEARFAEQEAEFERRLAATREAWVAEEGAVLAASMSRALAHIHDDLLAVTAQVLKPFLAEEVRKRALTELSRTIEDILKREPEAGITISGPQDLLKVLELQLSEHAGAMTFQPSASPEVEVVAGHALLSTRITAWVDRINEACP